MSRRLERKDCVNCGDPFRGTGELCPDCVPEDLDSEVPPATRPPYPLAMCRFCRSELSWENVGRHTRRLEEGQVECVYTCPSCRCALEFSSWTQEKS